MLPTEPMDFARRSLKQARFVYLASSDVAGAFDNVPHSHLICSLETFRVETHTRPRDSQLVAGLDFSGEDADGGGTLPQ